ncbi:MAG: hypothetical protein U0792_23970, partial [Gemmataceae bacterium]
MTIPNILAIGEPGSGKSVAAAHDAVRFPGARVILDPHKNSLGQLVLTHAAGEILYDRLSDLKYSIGYGFLRPSRHPEPATREQENLKQAQFFVELLMRRQGGGDIAGSPLKEEWILALL